MDVEDYTRALRQCKVGGLRMRRSRSDLRAASPDQVRLSAKVVEEHSVCQASEHEVLLQVTFALTAPHIDSRAVALRLEACFELAISSPVPLPEGFAEQYAATSLPFNVWPYFRQWVSATTAQAGLPPLTLGFRFLQ